MSWLTSIVLLESSGWTGLDLSRSGLHLRGGFKLSQEKWLEGQLPGHRSSLQGPLFASKSRYTDMKVIRVRAFFLQLP